MTMLGKLVSSDGKLPKGVLMMLKSLGFDPEEVLKMGKMATDALVGIEQRLADLQKRLATIEAAIFEEDKGKNGNTAITTTKPN